ncbi:MAG: hypothetical protein ABUK01_04300 [Leptospirales bacterium]
MKVDHCESAKKIWAVVVSVTALLSLLWGCSVFAQTKREQKILEHGILDYSDAKLGDVLARMRPTESKFIISAEKVGEVTASRGSRFLIPENAFVFPNGKRVTGNVEFKVKEVIDDFDFVTSGVDLSTVDENGQRVYLQSAGMFHVSAQSRGQELELAPGKKIDVQFPDIVPGDEFFVYKMNKSGQWEKHGHNQELMTQTNPVDGESSSIGVRVYAIDGMTWWNFDSPFPHVACLKGEVEDPDQVFVPPYKVTTIGMSYKGSFDRYIERKDFRINAHRSKYVKVLIVDTKGNVGISGNIKVTDKRGHDKYKEGEMVPEVDLANRQPTGKKYKNYCQDIGKIPIRKLSENIMKDKGAFQRYLGLNKEYYRVDYQENSSETDPDSSASTP